MTEPNKDWTNEQLERASVPEEFQPIIKELLEVFWAYDLDEVYGSRVADTFAELAKGHALVPDEPEAVWVQAKPGNLVVRDRVRVRADAYTGELGLGFNGREGDIVAIRYGDIHVRSQGDDGEFSIIRHKAEFLEKRVR